MDENKSILSYAGQMFSIYGIIVIIFIFFGLIIGDKASSYSLYSFGSKGFSMDTLLQLLILSFVITLSQFVFLTDRLIKDMKMFVRILIFFGSIIITIVLFVILCGWFPINDFVAWIGFAVSFIVCTTLSVIISRVKESTDNKKMEEALNKLLKE